MNPSKKKPDDNASILSGMNEDQAPKKSERTQTGDDDTAVMADLNDSPEK